MPTILNIISNTLYTDEECILLNEITNTLNDFYNRVINYTTVDDRIFEYKILNARYSEFDYRFKQIYNINPKSKYHCLFPRSYSKFNISKALDLYKFKKSGREIAYSKSKHEFVKYVWSAEILDCILTYITVFIVRTSPKISFAQLYLSFTLSLIEFFYAGDIDWNFAYNTMMNFINEREAKSIGEQVYHLKESYDALIRQRAESNTGKKHKKHKKHKRPNRKRKEIPAEEIAELLKTKSQTETKKILAEKYDLCLSTIQKRMSALKLTDKKYTTKNNKN